jgi:hypothetical protein
MVADGSSLKKQKQSNTTDQAMIDRGLDIAKV